MTDPREQIETNCLSVALIPDADTWDVDGGYVDWPEIVELAQKILAADEAWKDSQTPTLEELRARYPAWEITPVLYVAKSPDLMVYKVAAFPAPPGSRHWFSEEGNTENEAIRRLAAKLEELTDGK